MILPINQPWCWSMQKCCHPVSQLKNTIRFGIHMTQSRYEGTNKNYLTFNLLPVSSRLLRTASHAYALHLFGLHVTRCYVKSCCGSVIMMVLNLRNISVCLHTGLCLCSWSQAHFNPLLRVPISACKEMKLGIV